MMTRQWHFSLHSCSSTLDPAGNSLSHPIQSSFHDLEQPQAQRKVVHKFYCFRLCCCDVPAKPRPTPARLVLSPSPLRPVIRFYCHFSLFSGFGVSLSPRFVQFSNGIWSKGGVLLYRWVISLSSDSWTAAISANWLDFRWSSLFFARDIKITKMTFKR